MSAITYTANSRAPLVTDSPAHVDGTQYSIDVKLQQFTEAVEAPKSVHVSIAGNTETVLKRAAKIINIVLIWPNTLNADMEEFLYSISAGETFTFDPYGVVGVPDDPVNVVCMNDAFSIGRMSHGNTPWRSVGLTLRIAV